MPATGTGTAKAGRSMLLVFIAIVFCREMSTGFVSTSRSPPLPTDDPRSTIGPANCSYGHTWDFLDCLVNARDGGAGRLDIYNISGDRNWMHDFLPQTTLRMVAKASIRERLLTKSLVSDHVMFHVNGVADLNQLLSSASSLMVSSQLYSLIPAYTTKLTFMMGTTASHSTDASKIKLLEAFPLANISFVARTEDQSSNYLDSFPINLTDASLLICHQPESFYCTLSALLLGEELRTIISLKYKSSFDWLLDSQATTLPSLVLIDKKQHGPTVSIRSRIGSWSYDAAYGEKSFYEIFSNDKIWAIRDDFENQSMPTTYGSQLWTSFDDSLEFLNLRGFCQAMHDFGKKTRLIVAGDSLQYMHMVSFLYTLGMDRMNMTIRTHYHKKKRMRALQPIACPKGLPDIDLVFYRVNHAMAMSSISKTLFRSPSIASAELYSNFTKATPEQEEKLLKERSEFMQDELPKLYGTRRTLQEYYRCYGPMLDEFPDQRGYCPWHIEYLIPRNDTKYSSGSPPPNTLIYIGIGAHFHHENAFEESLHHFMRFVDDEVRPNDSVWFRTVAPGHAGCGSAVTNRTFGEPYKSFREYLEHGQTNQYDWNKFQYYNRVMENAVWDHERRRAQSSSPLPSLVLVDIYWMTALRKDGHGSSIDCLHYLLPGPPDWWSHLFYSQLVEAATTYKATRK